MPEKFLITKNFLKVLLCLKENPESNSYEIMEKIKLGFKSVMKELYMMKRFHLIRSVLHGHVEHYLLTTDGEELFNEIVAFSLNGLDLPLNITRKAGKIDLVVKIER